MSFVVRSIDTDNGSEFIDYEKLMKTPMSEEQCVDAIASLRSLLDD